jgi:DNA-binding transcriptional ArsR family regulator
MLAAPRTTSDDHALDAIFAALADPTRRAIVARLASGEATVLELAAPFHVTLPAISRHLKVLEKAGLIARGRDAQKRPCSLRAEALDEVTRWTLHTRRAWDERMDNLADYLKRLKVEGSAPPKAATPEPAPRTKTAPHDSPGHPPRKEKKPHARRRR